MSDPNIPQDTDGPWKDFASPDHVERGPWDDYHAPAQADPNAPGLLESFGRGVTGGASFGYDKSLGMSKDRDAEAAKANPWTHFAGEIAGGIIPAAVATLAAPEVAIPAGIAKAAPWLERGYAAVRSAFVPGEIGTLGQAVGQGAKLGTSYGALAGSGNADVDPSDTMTDALKKRAVGAVTGGVEGGVGGALFGTVGHGVYRGAQEIGGLLKKAASETASGGQGALKTMVKGFERDRISPQDLITQIRSGFPDDTQSAPGGLQRRFWGDIQNKQPITGDQVEETVRRAMSGQSAGQISKALSANGSGPGPDAVQSLLDELAARHLGPLNIIDRTSMMRPGSGDNTQMTMRAAAATPGDAKSIAKENLLERQVGAGGRLQDMFSRTLGSPDFDAVAQQHSDALQDAGARAYGVAYANEQPFDLNPVFAKWSAKFANQRGPIPDTINNVLNGMRSTQPVLDQAGNVVTGSGIVNKAPPMDLEGFINARQGLSDQIQSAMQSGNKNLARQLTQLHGDLTDEVARTNTAWKSANDLWSDGKAAQDALEAGDNMSTRLNASSRDNLKVFTDAQDQAGDAGDKLAKAYRDILGPKTRRAPTDKELSAASPAQQLAVRQAQSRLDAANSKQQLFKVGLVRALNDQIQNQGETNNLTRQLLLPGAKKMLSTVLGDDADQFFNGLKAEQAMHRTYSSQFGSQTTPLRESIDELNWAPRVDAAKWYSWMSPVHAVGNALDLASEYAAKNINAKRNSELMDLYTKTNPIDQLDILRNAQTLHTARSNAGNLAARPVVGSAAPVLNAYVGHQADIERTPPALQPYQPHLGDGSQ